jgi:hypothetical protein
MKFPLLTLILVSCAICSFVSGKISVTDPIIRMLDPYEFSQALQEVGRAEYMAGKYSDYLDLSIEDKLIIRELIEPLTMHSNQLLELQLARDKYLIILSHLDRDQRMKFKNLYFIELPTEELLITPTAQVRLSFSNEQKESIKNIYIGIPKRIKKKSGTDYAFEAEQSIKDEVRSLATNEMMALLTEGQTRHFSQIRKHVERKMLTNRSEQ